jgi:hypothetical protein
MEALQDCVAADEDSAGVDRECGRLGLGLGCGVVYNVGSCVIGKVDMEVVVDIEKLDVSGTGVQHSPQL